MIQSQSVFRGSWQPVLQVIPPKPGDYVDNSRCANCGKAPAEMLPCASCAETLYCSEECQRKHWAAAHEHKCKRTAEALPTLGVRVSHLLQAFSCDGTTADVGELVRKATRVTNKDGSVSTCSYAELLSRDASLKACVKQVADAFVCHVHSYKYNDLMLALSSLPTERYVWIDVFSVNLHKPNLEWWCRANHVVLCKAKKFELVVDSWDRPLALARAWCVWEIYGAVSQQVPMTTLLLPGESQRFRADLSEGRIDEDQWKNVFASINVQHLASNLAEDAARILGQIRRVGVLQVNDAVMVPVKKWLLDSALDCASGLKTGHCYIGLAALHRVFGETQESQRWYEKAREAFEKERGPEDASTITSRAWLADVLLEQGKLGEAGPVLEQVLAARSKLHGPESAEAAAAMNNLGGLRRATGDLQGAADLFEKALAIGEKLHGDKSPYVANTLNNLALVKEDLGDFQGAKTYHDRALEIRQSISPDHPACAQSLNNLAVWYHRQGDVPRAKELGKQALEIWQRALGAGHPESIQAKLDWGGD